MTTWKMTQTFPKTVLVSLARCLRAGRGYWDCLSAHTGECSGSDSKADWGIGYWGTNLGLVAPFQVGIWRGVSITKWLSNKGNEMASLIEQETTVTQLRNGDTNIWTANPVHLRALRKRVTENRASETRTWEDAAEFTIPNAEFDPLKGFRRKGKPMSDEQRQAASERLKNARSLNR